ncbi:MAG: substrate-binding domain-containing protein [Nitrospirae bacterium]|nr:substrate-binding domain-containing protein [Nitrospirota bacterium]
MSTEEYPKIPPTRLDDLHDLELMDEAQLILFMAGNQFMVMQELLVAFRERHPEVEKIFYETLPPGLELRQILAGGAIFQGRTITGRPDIYAAVDEGAMQELSRRGLIEEYHPYLHNRIVLMVPEGNPAGITSVLDLQRDDVRISQPGEMENITKYIAAMYEEAGGEELARRIMEEKRAEGSTIPTVVHHRETPLRIRKRTVDVGPVWATEALHAKSGGLEIQVIEPGEKLDQRDRVTYYVAKLKNAPHPGSARDFLSFILSREAQAIYKGYGFIPLLEI